MLVFLNGKYVSADKALISVDDRGFLFADGLYEVIRSYNGNPFRLSDHLSRLRRGCRELKIKIENIDHFKDICLKLISENRLDDCQATIYMQITRGAAARDHRFPSSEIHPTVYIAARKFIPAFKQLEEGIKTMLVADNRWGRCDIKTVMLLPNVLARQYAFEHGADEALFGRDGIILEGSHSNFFAVINGRVRTHPPCPHILPGITRQAVMTLCQDLNLTYEEIPVHENQIEKASELFVAGTTLEITPVIAVGEVVIGNGRPGPVTRLLQRELAGLTGTES